jgi:hypothetical protein
MLSNRKAKLKIKLTLVPRILRRLIRRPKKYLRVPLMQIILLSRGTPQ